MYACYLYILYIYIYVYDMHNMIHKIYVVYDVYRGPSSRRQVINGIPQDDLSIPQRPWYHHYINV